jgi:mono/diheme cytochrome c family protein
MKIHGVLIAAAFAALPAWPSVAADEPSRVAAAPSSGQDEAELAAQGKMVYAQHCSHCHGFNMVNPGTVTFDLRRFPHEDKARFVHSVTQGKNGRMPPWGDLLKPEEIEQLWAYVLTGGAQ